MKKIISVLLIILILLTIIPLTIVSADENINSSNSEFSVYSYTNYPTLYISNTYNSVKRIDIATKYSSLMSKIPITITKKLKTNKVTVYIVKDSNVYYTGSTKVTGFYNVSNKKIYVNENKLEKILYHEVGHAIDKNYGKLSTKTEFKNAYKIEKKAFGASASVMSVSDASEMFAEVFRLYILAIFGNSYYKTILINKAPKSTTFVKTKLGLKLLT